MAVEPGLLQVGTHGCEEPRRDRHHPLSAALALGHEQPSLTGAEVLNTQAQHLAAAQPAQQHRVDHGPVAVGPQRDDIHVNVQVDRHAAKPAQCSSDRGRIGGDAANLAGGEGVALGGVEVPGISEHDVAVGHRPQPERVADRLGAPGRPASPVACRRGTR